jgi:hypothetical protein
VSALGRYGEPWTIDESSIHPVHADGAVVGAYSPEARRDLMLERGRRAAACVNACQGIGNVSAIKPALSALVDAVRQAGGRTRLPPWALAALDALLSLDYRAWPP